MTNQDHIDKIINLILKSRKMEPSKIEAFSKVISALAQVREKASQLPNIVPEDDVENGLAPDTSMMDFTRDMNVQFGENGLKRKIAIIPN